MSHVQELRSTVEDATPKLLALGDKSADRPAPDKWSPKEIIGHLIDSASTNHQRFIRSQLDDNLMLAGYAQNDWVRVGRYADAPWEDLVMLWRTFNLQIARVMEGTPEEVRMRAHSEHNLDARGIPYPAGGPGRLEYVMSDYVTHLRHHLRQIFPC